MERRINGGSSPAVKMDQNQLEEFKKHRKQQLQLKAKRKKEKQQLDEKRRVEEEMLFKDPAQAKASSDELAQLREQVKKLQQKYSQVNAELQDMTKETNDQKQELLYLIANNETDLKFSNALLASMLKESDIYKIKQKSAWDEFRKEWTVPAFILTDKKQDVSFPTINGKQRVE